MTILDKIAAAQRATGKVNGWAAFVPKSFQDLDGLGSLYLIGPDSVWKASERSNTKDYANKVKANPYYMQLEYFTHTMVIVMNKAAVRHEMWVNSPDGPVEIGWKLSHEKRDWDFDFNIISKEGGIIHIGFAWSGKKHLVNYMGKHVSLDKNDIVAGYGERIIVKHPGEDRIKKMYNLELQEVKNK